MVPTKNDSVERFVQYAKICIEFTDKCGVRRLDNLAKHVGIDLNPVIDVWKEIENAGIKLRSWQKGFVEKAINQDIEGVWDALGVVEENRQRHNPCAKDPAALFIKAIQHHWKPNSPA